MTLEPGAHLSNVDIPRPSLPVVTQDSVLARTKIRWESPCTLWATEHATPVPKAPPPVDGPRTSGLARGIRAMIVGDVESFLLGQFSCIVCDGLADAPLLSFFAVGATRYSGHSPLCIHCPKRRSNHLRASSYGWLLNGCLSCMGLLNYAPVS
jgi:hypothetical protein